MNIIFLTLSVITDINSRGIYTDLMRKFQKEGHNIYIVSPRERKLNKPTSYIKKGNTNILGVRTLNIQKTNFIEKGIGTLLIEAQYKHAITHYFKNIKFDLILYSTPPITFTNVIKYLKRKNINAISYLLLKDIFPQNAVDLNMFSKRSPIYHFFRHKEKQLYRVSDYIGCMSPANVNFVIKNNSYISKDKIEVNPNSIELSSCSEETNRSLIRKKYSLPTNIPILIYGGNLGKPQGIDFLIDVLKSNINNSDRFFLIVGTGTEFNRVKVWFESEMPSNARLMNGLSKIEYDKLVKSCDIGLIFLDHRFSIPNYPSRLLSYLENKMPILAATDKNTDIGKIAEENDFGFWAESNNIVEFNELIHKFIHSDYKQMGENGYKFLLDNYLVDNSYNIIVKHLN
ncbi:MAG: glycosyltransferase family 4 protein [Muribaculaceae bacterium]